MNPLVALYFACCSKEKTEEEEESQGVIYYGSAYAKHSNDIDVIILSSLAKMKIMNSTTLHTLKEQLELEDNNPEHLIQTIQGTLFVMPKYSNNRLVSQSGAFLLVGAVSIEEDPDKIWNSKVRKSIHNMNSAFKAERIVIPEDCKDTILDELDFLNINEASLFPELEHQMSHIKRVGTSNIESIPEFIKYQIRKSGAKEKDINSDDENVEPKKLNEIVAKRIHSKEMQEIACRIIQKYSEFPDWNRKESTISALKIELKRALSINDRNDSKGIVEQIISDIQHQIKS